LNCNYRARLSIVDSHKSTGDGPVRSSVCNPSKTEKTKETTKANNKKQAKQPKTHQEEGLQPVGIHAR